MHNHAICDPCQRFLQHTICQFIFCQNIAGVIRKKNTFLFHTFHSPSVGPRNWLFVELNNCLPLFTFPAAYMVSTYFRWGPISQGWSLLDYYTDLCITYMHSIVGAYTGSMNNWIQNSVNWLPRFWGKHISGEGGGGEIWCSFYCFRVFFWGGFKNLGVG